MCNTDREDVDKEEAGFWVIEAWIAMQKAERARKVLEGGGVQMGRGHG
jgi:hypothetical protein